MAYTTKLLDQLAFEQARVLEHISRIEVRAGWGSVIGASQRERLLERETSEQCGRMKALILAAFAVLIVASCGDGPMDPAKYGRTWLTPYDATSCGDWSTLMTPDQRSAAAAHLLQGLWKRDGHDILPLPATIEKLRVEMDRACKALPTEKINLVAFASYIESSDLQPPSVIETESPLASGVHLAPCVGREALTDALTEIASRLKGKIAVEDYLDSIEEAQVALDSFLPAPACLGTFKIARWAIAEHTSAASAWSGCIAAPKCKLANIQPLLDGRWNAAAKLVAQIVQ